MKKKKNIFIIRHAEKSRDGLSITPRGRLQINHLIKYIKTLDINKIYSSDIPRCIMTTELIRKEIPVEIIYSPTLREVPDEIWKNPQRNKTKIEEIAKLFKTILRDEKKNILVVSSGNVNKILITQAMQVSSNNAHFIQIPTCINHLEVINNELRIVSINNTSHLPERLRIRQDY